MYDKLHREPAFDGTSAQDAYTRAEIFLNRYDGLDRYEYVAERPLHILVEDDSRSPRDVIRELAWKFHLARKIDGGWEFHLVIAGD